MTNNKKKRSFFEKLTGSVRLQDEEEVEEAKVSPKVESKTKDTESWMEEADDAELAIDVYETPTEIVVKTMVAGVRPEDVKIDITRDTITIKGKREENRTIDTDDYYSQELYWGSFSRTVTLPQEVEPEKANAVEKHGLLIVKIPKIDKDKQASLKIKSI